MVNPFHGGRGGLLLALSVCVLPLLLAAHPPSSTIAPGHVPQSRFHDWTTRHVLYPRVGTVAALEAARTDPRALFHWHEMDLQTQTAHTLFVSLRRTVTGIFSNLYTFNMAGRWNATIVKTATTGIGTSGIIVDNASASAQASSIYFNALNQDSACSSPQTGTNTNGCATQLTQAALQ
jgi:hypothetical protein